MTFGHRTDYLFVVGCKVDGTIVGDSKRDLFIGSKENASRMAIAQDSLAIANLTNKLRLLLQ